MTSTLAGRMEPFKRRSRRFRNHAIGARARDSQAAGEHFAMAAETLQEAIDYLRGLGDPDPHARPAASESEVEIAAQLADCWGMLGGVYRAEGKLPLAREAYDAGAVYESSRRFGILNTYNQVNRLIVRIMERPELLSPAAPPVTDLPGTPAAPMHQLLHQTTEEIERQLREGRMDRPWALADLVMVRLLGGQEGVDQALAALDESSANDFFPYESTLRVIRELAAKRLSVHDRLIALGEQLQRRLPEHLRGEPLQPASV